MRGWRLAWPVSTFRAARRILASTPLGLPIETSPLGETLRHQLPSLQSNPDAKAPVLATASGAGGGAAGDGGLAGAAAWVLAGAGAAAVAGGGADEPEKTWVTESIVSHPQTRSASPSPTVLMRMVEAPRSGWRSSAYPLGYPIGFRR
jgi:hypothetical protein